MARLLIRGGAPLAGTYRVGGNKNAALPMLAASLLTDQPVILHRVPDIVDVQVMLQLLASLGVHVSSDGSTVRLSAATLRSRRLDPALCRRVRSSILLAGPLAARHGRAVLPPPGGDVIGRRRLDTHFDGLQALGIQIEGHASYTFRRKVLHSADILFDEASVTATENVMMAAALADGVTTVHNAACEPHVQDLGHLLITMGAAIDGLGTNRLIIRGVPSLHGTEYTVGPDYIELGSFMTAAAVTRGQLVVQDPPDDMTMAVAGRAMSRLGISWQHDGPSLLLPPKQRRSVLREFSGAMTRIEDGPWPAFPSDLMSVALVLATQTRGNILFFEKMFESRMYFVDRLLEMGAQLVQCDPHRVVVSGPSRLHGCHLTSPDIRAGMSLVIAALCARGVSVIENAQMIDRGYEHIDERLRALGADITRES